MVALMMHHYFSTLKTEGLDCAVDVKVEVEVGSIK